MIAVGALPTVPFFWMILPPLAGLTVIVAAAFDAAEARSLGERGTPLWPVSGWCWPASSSSRPRWSPRGDRRSIPGTLIVAPVLLGLVIYLGLRQRRRPA